VRDTSELELKGVPCVAVASSEFQDAAEVQGRQIGFNPVMVYTRHPIQDRTDAEMAEIADKSVEAIVAGLLGPEGSEGAS
jgi:hypothetical protein